jgi:hypothetical protein
MQMNKPNNLIDSEPSTNYIPINVHPNPYGISAQNPIMPNMQQQPNEQQMQQMRQIENLSADLSEEHLRELRDMRPVHLPSKHVKIDTQSYTQDEEVQPNYIPRHKLTKDYILDYEESFEKDRIINEKKKHRESKVDAVLTELQIPIMIAVLFMVFQLPIINTMIFKRFSFLMIYHEDGTFNFYGLIFKSILFGSAYYIFQKSIEYLADL